jgi:mono/diheme cytochrome c family protein
MGRMRWFLLGVAFAGAIGIAATAVVLLNARGFSAKEQPTGVERWIAVRARSAALPRDARSRNNPVTSSREVLAEARAHWADHCAICHANDGSGDTVMGKRTYPPAPDMRLPATQQMTDGELFYIIQNGIRMSAMPAWGSGSDHDAEDSWKLVHFIRHLPQMTAEERKEMEKMNPKTLEELKEEQAQEKFLRGEDRNEQPVRHHHE